MVVDKQSSLQQTPIADFLENSAGQSSERNLGLDRSSEEVLSPITEFYAKVQQLIETAKSAREDIDTKVNKKSAGLITDSQNDPQVPIADLKSVGLTVGDYQDDNRQTPITDFVAKVQQSDETAKLAKNDTENQLYSTEIEGNNPSFILEIEDFIDKLNDKISYSTDISYNKNKKNLENEENSSIFAELNNNEYGREQQTNDRISRRLVEANRKLDTGAKNRGSFQTTDRTESVIGKTELLGNLERLAKESRDWIEHPEELISTLPIGKGFENEVFMSADGKSVIKFNNLSVSETLDKFLARIKAHNRFASNVPYTILGIGKNSQGETSIILEQPYIPANPAPIERVMLYLKDKGFKPARLSNGVEGFRNDEYEIDLWKNDGSMVADNVLMDDKGTLYFIDADITAIENRINSNQPKGKTLDDTGLPLC